MTGPKDDDLWGEDDTPAIDENIEDAENTVKWYKNLFGDDYYLELQRHQTDVEGADKSTFELQERVNKVILQLLLQQLLLLQPLHPALLRLQHLPSCRQSALPL